MASGPTTNRRQSAVPVGSTSTTPLGVQRLAAVDWMRRLCRALGCRQSLRSNQRRPQFWLHRSLCVLACPPWWVRCRSYYCTPWVSSLACRSYPPIGTLFYHGCSQVDEKIHGGMAIQFRITRQLTVSIEGYRVDFWHTFGFSGTTYTHPTCCWHP